MRRMMSVGLVAVLFLALAGPSGADEQSHKQAAARLLQAMNMDKQLQQSIDQMIDLQVKANPQLAQFKAVMRRFLAKHMSYASLKDDLVKIYTDAFSEDELKEITSFYLTPVGKKMVEKTPELMSKGMQLGAKRVQDNQAELLRMLREAQNNNQ